MMRETTQQIAQEIHARWLASEHKVTGQLPTVALHVALIFELSGGNQVAPILELGSAPGTSELVAWVNVWAAHERGGDGYFDLAANPPVLNAPSLPGHQAVKTYMVHDFHNLVLSLYEGGCGPLIADLSPVLDSIYSERSVA